MAQQTTRERWRHLQRPVAWLRQQEPVMLLALLLVVAGTWLFIELADTVFNSSHRVCIRPPSSRHMQKTRFGAALGRNQRHKPAQGSVNRIRVWEVHAHVLIQDYITWYGTIKGYSDRYSGPSPV